MSHSIIFDVFITGEEFQTVYLYVALMAIDCWGFLSLPHLLWHRVSVYNTHLRGPMTLTPVAERLAMELLLPVYGLSCFADWNET